MLQRQGLLRVALSMCVKNIFATAGSHSGQLQCSIWASTHLLVCMQACGCVCVECVLGGSGGVQITHIFARGVSVNDAGRVWQRGELVTQEQIPNSRHRNDGRNQRKEWWGNVERQQKQNCKQKKSCIKRKPEQKRKSPFCPKNTKHTLVFILLFKKMQKTMRFFLLKNWNYFSCLITVGLLQKKFRKSCFFSPRQQSLDFPNGSEVPFHLNQTISMKIMKEEHKVNAFLQKVKRLAFILFFWTWHCNF